MRPGSWVQGDQGPEGPQGPARSRVSGGMLVSPPCRSTPRRASLTVRGLQQEVQRISYEKETASCYQITVNQ